MCPFYVKETTNDAKSLPGQCSERWKPIHTSFTPSAFQWPCQVEKSHWDVLLSAQEWLFLKQSEKIGLADSVFFEKNVDNDCVNLKPTQHVDFRGRPVWWSSNFPYFDIVPMHKSWRMKGWLIWKADGVNEVWVGIHLSEHCPGKLAPFVVSFT